ncbi:DUF2339 domain-containing protein [Nocardia sp. 348MFTsu5.1]|uniref:DUF2339 domain-containing protein n=1 Tax=Nocardia sp. 348MFTsu5.1 TaxID=1172185 RepID=UPI001E5B4590|nr:DUF2339 domain-containing protein [Nocardia sp. 348MFTsu5.1]
MSTVPTGPYPSAYSASASRRPGPPPPSKPSLWQRMTAESGGGLIGKVLAVAGVTVTLIGVVMMLVLAAQAGILRPEIRVVAGGVLAIALVMTAVWMAERPGGRVGAIALSATGIAAAYFDVVAITRIYDWLPDYSGLVLAGLITFSGLLLARRWDSEHLALLVLVPVFILAPVLTAGPSLLLVGSMLAMAIGSFPIQLGKDWIWLHAVRVTAATSVQLAWIAASVVGDDEHLVVGVVAMSVAAAFGITTSAVLARGTRLPPLTALLGCATALPVLLSPLIFDRWTSAGLIGGVAVLLLVVALLDREQHNAVRYVYATSSAVAAVVGVAVAFEGPVIAPVLLAMSIVIAVAARHDLVGRVVATSIGVLGGVGYLAISPPEQLLASTELAVLHAVSVIVASVLVVVAVWTLVWSWYQATERHSAQNVQGFGILGALASLYAVTALTVTAGVAFGGPDGGFLGGHVAATICWMIVAAGLLVISISIAKGRRMFGGIGRNIVVTAGLLLTAAAVAKLFLFDLATLNGIFRVTVFIVVGLILLALGSGYARALGQGEATMTELRQ